MLFHRQVLRQKWALVLLLAYTILQLRDMVVQVPEVLHTDIQAVHRTV